MRRSLLSAILVLVAASTPAADEIEPLDGAFLEYLANLEADDADWTVLDTVEPDADQPKPAAKPATDAEAKTSTKVPKPRKSTKEAAEPAVQER